jgi:hypothetical protein
VADNSPQGGTDTIRDIDRAGVKTQVMQVDVGGAAAESLLVRGQQVKAASIPVTLASDQTVALDAASLAALEAITARAADQAGVGIDSLAAAAGQNGLMVAIGATNYVAAPNNSTTVQLAAGATFAGTIENAFNEPAASILLTCDQPGILTVNQYITTAAGTIVASTPFVTPAVSGGNCFARSFVTNGNDINITFKNTGAVATTTLNLNTAYGTIPAATQLLNAPCAVNEIAGVAVTALTKGAQGAAGFTTQDLKDAGRSVNNLFMATPIITTATDALQSLTGFAGTAAVAATTTPAVVTAGKTRRIDSLTLTYVAIATAGSAKFTLRANPAGVVVIGSPAVATWVVGGPAAVAGVTQTAEISFPNGMEFAAGTGLGISVVGLSATQVATAVGYAQAALTSTEY